MNTPALTPRPVTLSLEDWGDDDRRLMLLNMYAGQQSLGLFDTYAQAQAYAATNGLYIQPDATKTPFVNPSNKLITPYYGKS